MENTTTGLILGKFAPFHRGHQYLLEFAKERVNKLYVLIYDAKNVTDIPLATRANWIRKLYPDVIVIEGYNGPTEEGHTLKVVKLQEDYIIRMIPEKITHFFSSEWYGDHVSKALGATNVLVDADRKNVPVSATKVRNGEVATFSFLNPIVNRDVIKKVVLLGAESTGKTTLANSLAKTYFTLWVPEYGREYWDNHHDSDGKLTPDQLVELAKTHRAREEAAFKFANRIVFIDTGATTTRQYCRDYGYIVPLELDALVKSEESRYDIFILCDTDIPYVEDGTRRGAETRMETQQKIIKDLIDRGISYHTISGNLENRMADMRRIIGW